MIQGILVMLIFLGAVAYLGWILYKQFQAKSACASACGKCGAMNFKKIEAQIEKKG